MRSTSEGPANTQKSLQIQNDTKIPLLPLGSKKRGGGGGGGGRVGVWICFGRLTRDGSRDQFDGCFWQIVLFNYFH